MVNMSVESDAIDDLAKELKMLRKDLVRCMILMAYWNTNTDMNATVNDLIDTYDSIRVE
jgi:hypothetical protein